MTEEMIKQLLALPKSIRIKQLELLDLRNDIEEVQKSIKKIELTVQDNITKRVGADGKPLHSNEIKRKFAFNEEIKKNLTYKELSTRLGLKESRLKNEDIECDFQRRVFRGLEAVARLGVE